MSERLTSRNETHELLFNGIRVIAGEHALAYLTLEEKEDRIAELEAENEGLKKARDEMTLAAFKMMNAHDLSREWARRWKRAAKKQREENTQLAESIKGVWFINCGGGSGAAKPIATLHDDGAISGEWAGGTICGGWSRGTDKKGGAVDARENMPDMHASEKV